MYFVNKIKIIRSKFPDKVQNIPQVQKPEIRSKMNVFERALEDEIKKKTCGACFNHIRDLRRIRKSLSLDLTKQIAVALVSSKLDYCNSLFHKMPEKDITRLQRFQNCLARVVTKAPRFSRSVPILKRLHWLPVKFRINFKI